MVIGRQQPLTELIAVGEQSSVGARVAWLVGAEGVGKSTLARAAAQRSGLPVHRLDVYPEDRDHPLASLTELALTLGSDPGGELADDPAHALLRALEAAGPCCVVIEDAQWLDEASQLAVWQVVRRFRRLPVWLVVTSTDDTGTLFDGLTLLLRSPDAGQIFPIGPFTSADTEAFLREELGIPIGGAALDAVMQATGGYPAMLVSLVDQLRLAGRGTSIQRTLRTLTTRSQRSGLVRQHVTSVWDAAAASERATLLALAQAGDLTAAQLGGVLRARGLADSGMSALLATGLVERIGTDALRLKHRLAAREIIDRVAWADAAASHAALADLLTGLDALEHRVAAADAATAPAVLAEVRLQMVDAYARTDLEQAFHLARQGARLDPDLMVEAVLAALRAGRPDWLVGVPEALAAMPPSVTRIAAQLIVEAEHLDPLIAAEQLTRLDTGRIEDPRDLVVLAHAAAYVTLQALLTSEPDLGRLFRPLIGALSARSEDLWASEPAFATEMLVTAHVVEVLLVHAFDHRTPPRDRVAALTGFQARVAADPRLTALDPLVSALKGVLLLVTGDLASARAALSEGVAARAATVRMQARLALAAIAFADGDWDQAHALADRELAASLDTLQASMWQQAFAVAALVPAVRGEQAVVEEYLGWQASEGVAGVADAHRNLALAWGRVAQTGTDAEVGRLLDQVWLAGQTSFTGAFPTGPLRVAGHLAAGDRVGAGQARDELLAEPYEADATGYALAHADALLATDAAAADAAFARAADLLAAQHAAQPQGALRVNAAVLAEHWAIACDRAGRPRPDAASALLAQAIRLLDRNGAPAWRDRLSVLAAQDAPAPAGPASGWAELTSREREVALLAAQGLTNKEIATRLFVTVRTAEYHIHHALAKLKLASRQQLRVALADLSAPQPARP